MKKTNKLVYISLLIAQALALYVVESAIPSPLPTPGAKIGLSNIITVIALYTLSYKDAFTVLSVRILLSVMFGGGVSRLLYSLGGAILSFSFMALAMKTFKEKISIVGISVIGAVFHNLGQIIVAVIIVKTPSLMLYLPVLTLVGIIMGFFIGLTSNFALNHLYKITSKMNMDFIQKRSR